MANLARPTVDKSIRRAYRVLGVPSGAPQEDIKQAYRDLAQVWHPDRFEHNDRLREKAQRNFKRVNEAFEMLENYQPASQSRPSRLSMTVSAVLDLGDLLQTREIHRAVGGGSQPVRPRSKPVILGLGGFEATGVHRVRRQSSSKLNAVFIAILVVAVVLLALLMV